jgi:hypothetical protein
VMVDVVTAASRVYDLLDRKGGNCDKAGSLISASRSNDSLKRGHRTLGNQGRMTGTIVNVLPHIKDVTTGFHLYNKGRVKSKESPFVWWAPFPFPFASVTAYNRPKGSINQSIDRRSIERPSPRMTLYPKTELTQRTGSRGHSDRNAAKVGCHLISGASHSACFLCPVRSCPFFDATGTCPFFYATGT